jgi:hypothetical protein
MEETAPLEKLQRSVVQKKLAPRSAKVKAGAAMAGYDSVGHQDAATFKKLNTAALLILAHERQSKKMMPAAALTHADLPANDPMSKRLARRVAQLRKVVEAVDGGLGLPPPTESDDEDDESDSDDDEEMLSQKHLGGTGWHLARHCVMCDVSV